MGRFCVYVYRREVDGKPFYVGKGTLKRARNKSARSERFRRTYAKHGGQLEILIQDVNEICAFSMETALIKLYGRENLVNMTDGGEGTSGRAASESQKMKCSASNRGKAPAPSTQEAAKKKNSKPVGTTCGLRFASAAEAARALFPKERFLSAKTMISASCRGNRVSQTGGCLLYTSPSPRD